MFHGCLYFIWDNILRLELLLLTKGWNNSHFLVVSNNLLKQEMGIPSPGCVSLDPGRLPVDTWYKIVRQCCQIPSIYVDFVWWTENRILWSYHIEARPFVVIWEKCNGWYSKYWRNNMQRYDIHAYRDVWN